MGRTQQDSYLHYRPSNRLVVSRQTLKNLDPIHHSLKVMTARAIDNLQAQNLDFITRLLSIVV